MTSVIKGSINNSKHEDNKTSVFVKSKKDQSVILLEDDEEYQIWCLINLFLL